MKLLKLSLTALAAGLMLTSCSPTTFAQTPAGLNEVVNAWASDKGPHQALWSDRVRVFFDTSASQLSFGKTFLSTVGDLGRETTIYPVQLVFTDRSGKLFWRDTAYFFQDEFGTWHITHQTHDNSVSISGYDPKGPFAGGKQGQEAFSSPPQK